MLVIDGNIEAVYIFRKTCTFIEKEKTGGKIPGIDAHYVDDDEYEAVSMSKEEASYNYKKTAEDLMKERNY